MFGVVFMSGLDDLRHVMCVCQLWHVRGWCATCAVYYAD